MPLFFLMLALASVFSANPYAYGLDNHFITLPFILEKANPELYPGDWVLAEIQYFYTWFLDGMGALLRHSTLPLEWIVFALHVLFSFLTFWAFYHLAKVLTDCRNMAAVACLLLLFGTKTIGYVGTLESHLMERTIVLPLELLALAWMLKRRWVAAFAATGLAFCIHPLSSFYIGAMIGAAALYSLYSLRKEQLNFSPELKQVALGIAAGALFALPGLYLKFSAPEPLMPAGTPLPGWLDILALRSSYHVFPFEWPWHGWLRAAGFWIGVYLLNRSLAFTQRDRLVMATWAAVGIMAVLGTVFSQFIPLSLPIQFQFFRSYPFAFLLGMVFMARGIVLAARGQIPIFQALLAVILAAPAWAEMDLLKYLAMLMTWALMLGAAWYGVRRKNWPKSTMVSLPLLFVLMLAPLSIYLKGFSIYNQQEPEWVAVQHWAREQTPLDAAFIVPPNRRGFRVDSHRTVFVDWNDGTQNFFNQAFGPAWLERMNMAGFNGNPDDMGIGYRALEAEAFGRMAAILEANSQVYAVLFRDQPAPGPVLFENAHYQVFRVR